MDTKDKTARPEKGDQITEPVRESVSGLDVRQLLGLGRVEPAPAPSVDAVEIELPASNTTKRQAREAPQIDIPADEPAIEAPTESVSPSQRERGRQTPPSAPIEETQRPSSPPQRPPRPAFENVDVQPSEVVNTPEQSIDSQSQSKAGSGINDVARGDDQRPIPPVTHPSEISRLRPSIDPLAATASLAAARPGGEEVPPSPDPVTPDPSVAANAKLEELASLSERTLEDYETFDDFDDTTPQRSKRTPVIILASLLCVGVLAGGVIFAYRQGVRESSQTTLPIIVADTKPAKEEPSNPGGVKIPHQNKLIYDRILGEETDIAEKIIPREEKAVRLSQQPAHTTLTKTTPSAKVVAPPVPGVPANPEPANAIKKVAKDAVAKKLAEVTPPKPVSPPDDLINDNGTAPGVKTPDTTQPLTETLKLLPKKPEPAAAPDPATKVGEIVRLETETLTGVPAETPKTAESSAEKLAIAKLVEETVGADTEPAVKGKLPPVLPRRKPPAPSTTASRVASTPTPTPTPETSARSVAGGYVVQIAAFRSQEEALSRYARLKRRHTSLLKPYTSFVQRADLGDRGVYYRLRLGPIDGKDKASELCRSLLSAGEKDCLVRLR